MKKTLLIVCALLLTACGSVSGETSNPSSHHDVTQELEKTYAGIYKDYKELIPVEHWEQEEFPLVNPTSVKMLQQFMVEKAADVVAKEVDLDSDGTNELLVGFQTPISDSEKMTVYGQIKGKVIDLLSDILVEDADDFMMFYKNNRMRLDQTTHNNGGSGIYELTDEGLKELIFISVDLEGDLVDGHLVSKDRQGNIIEDTEKKIEEVIGHPHDQEVIE
ncbi:hypothetical protein D3X11_06215 [Streptococcus sp. X16XC17]|uniref:hypothetical protein n=1 Tax=unclassified Streptococcus TaxID=2608887 RepID=UPI00066FF25C|nr:MULTISPECIES: hypothetical protein [unclassified Streptococcus]TCD45802.1 hypothetical protein D3X11_06215 [Streptococcus sp. X16XC17]